MATSKIPMVTQVTHEIEALSVSGYFSNSASATVTPVIPDGYKFLCWVQASSVGWVNLVYPAEPANPSSTFWTPNAISGGFSACYLVYR